MNAYVDWVTPPPFEKRAEAIKYLEKAIAAGKIGIGPCLQDGHIIEVSLMPYRPGDEEYGVHPVKKVMQP